MLTVSLPKRRFSRAVISELNPPIGNSSFKLEVGKVCNKVDDDDDDPAKFEFKDFNLIDGDDKEIREDLFSDLLTDDFNDVTTIIGFISNNSGCFLFVVMVVDDDDDDFCGVFNLLVFAILS